MGARKAARMDTLSLSDTLTGSRKRKPGTNQGSPAFARLSGEGCPPGSDSIESIEIHDLVPRGNEVAHEFLPCVVARVDLRERPELGVRSEDEVDTARGSLELALRTTATLEGHRSFRRWLPLRVHVEEVHEEVVGQRPGPHGEQAAVRLGARVEDTHAADEHRHLGGAQCQPESSLDQQMLGWHLVSLSDVVTEPVRVGLEHGEGL